ncbi:MAG: hypothetical protein ACLPSF_02855 [Methylocella sp.]
MSLEPPRPNFAPRQTGEDGPWLESQTPLRIGLFSLGGVLALGGVWMLLSALLAPPTVALPFDRDSAAAAAANRDHAVAAARLGVVRGDLYAQAAYSDAPLLWLDRAHGLGAANAAEVRAARTNAETALALAPINGSAWLFLAALPPASARTMNANSLAALQMSYLTAPDDLALARPRIERALASGIPIDKDLQAFLKGDLREILARRPLETPAILAAYKAASPQNQAIFEALAAEVDPDFAQSVRSGAPK